MPDSVTHALEPLFEPSTLWPLVAVLALTVILGLIRGPIIRRLIHGARQTSSPWDNGLLEALDRPLGGLIYVVGLSAAAELIRAATDGVALGLVPPIRDTLVVLLIAWFLTRLVRRMRVHLLAEAHRKHESWDRTTVDAVQRILQVAILVVAALAILQNLGFSLSGVLAFGGVGGIAVGLAARELLANFFGGLTIYLDRPFAIGDWIRSPERDIEGTVEAIGWRTTRIRTFDQRPRYVPNSVFTTITVENASRMHHRRLYESFGIRYEDTETAAEIIEAIRESLRHHTGIAKEDGLMVNVEHFGTHALEAFLYTFTHTTDWAEFNRIRQEVLLDIARIIRTHGGELVYPTQRVALTTQGPGAVMEAAGSGPTESAPEASH